EGIYADWCLVERERLARLRLRAMGQVMAACLHRQAFADALEWGQAILAEDPLREEVHRALMRCYQQLGQHGRAIAQFQQCAQLLQDELAVLPLPETIAAYQQIITDRLQSLPTGQAGAAVQTAFANFQQAAQHLNNLLEQKQE
ncbi:MAG: bacterial transcriptional activator domain-containing protein, partial [Anaerolineae bacterium]